MSRDVKWLEYVLPYTLSPEELHHIIPSSHEHKIQQPSSWEDSSDDGPDETTYSQSPATQPSLTSPDVPSSSSSAPQPATSIPPQPLK